MSQVITLHIGGAGINIGAIFWKTVMKDCGISATGELDTSSKDTSGELKSSISTDYLFYLDENDVYIPRTVFIDMDQNQLDEVRTDKIFDNFYDHQFVSGKED